MGNWLSGGRISYFTQLSPPAPKWTANDIPDLTGNVMIVTGGNTGIGRETVKALLEHNAKVYLAARSEDKAKEVIRYLKQTTGKEAKFLHLDLSSLVSVRTAAAEFMRKETELHVLFNNAGVMVPPLDLLTEDGLDLQWGTNVVGHWLFTELLMPALLRAAENASDKKARVVTTSSIGSYRGDLNFTSFTDGPARRNLTPHALYYQSKFGNVMVAAEVARRYGDQGIVSISLHPGVFKSDLGRHMTDQPMTFSRRLLMIFVSYFLYPVWYGAITQLYAGTAPEAANLNGKWLVSWARVADPNPKTQDAETGRKLWAWLERNTKE